MPSKAVKKLFIVISIMHICVLRLSKKIFCELNHAYMCFKAVQIFFFSKWFNHAYMCSYSVKQKKIHRWINHAYMCSKVVKKNFNQAYMCSNIVKKISLWCNKKYMWRLTATLIRNFIVIPSCIHIRCKAVKKIS